MINFSDWLSDWRRFERIVVTLLAKVRPMSHALTMTSVVNVRLGSARSKSGAWRSKSDSKKKGNSGKRTMDITSIGGERAAERILAWKIIWWRTFQCFSWRSKEKRCSERGRQTFRKGNREEFWGSNSRSWTALPQTN